MIKNIQISGIRYELTDQTKKYVLKKVGRLDRYLPRHARKSASAEVVLRQVDKPKGNKYEAEIILNVPDKQMVAKDTTMNVLAAIDIAEAKILNQVQKYKDESLPHTGRRRGLARFKRSYQPEETE